jgi:hypothetical protein
MMTCRCPMCGSKNAGKTGGRSYGAAVVGRDEHKKSDHGRHRAAERQLRRRREDRQWRKEEVQ